MSHGAYKRYVLAVLTLTYTLSIADQSLIGLLLQPIKESLRLSDTQLGFVTGIGFALCYATLAIPFGRWADRGNRCTIASLAICVWGTAVGACVLVRNFTQLILLRVAASIGAAGCMPPTYSLVGDYFEQPAQRTRAITVYMLSNSLAASLSVVIGGWLNERYGWRGTFLVIAAPALLVAVLVKVTVAEPRMRAPHGRSPMGALPPTASVLQALWRQRTTRQLVLGIISLSIAGFGLASWEAVFLIRSHGMDTVTLGVWFGLITGVGGVAGTGLSGFVAGRCFSQDERGQLRLIALVIGGLFPGFLIFLLIPGKVAALIALFPTVVLIMAFWGPTFALLQRLVADNMRATAFAMVMLLLNLIGMGVGPQLVGSLSDALLPSAGSNSLRYAMLIVSVLTLWSAYHFWRAGSFVREELSAMAESSAHSSRDSGNTQRLLRDYTIV